MKKSENFIEVEVKARIRDSLDIERRVRKIAKYSESYICRDTYFTYASTRGYQEERFRLRLMKGKAVVTAKERKNLAGVEANAEHEFQVDDIEAFREFLRLFGFRVLIEKTKRIKKFSNTPRGKKSLPGTVSIELNDVKGLGKFIEIEALVKKSSEMKKARRLILKILDTLEIPRDQIELTPYTRMLYDRKFTKTSR